MLHKFHPHSCKIHAFLSVFLAFHGKTASFLIYYKMKTTFTFENFLSRVRFGAVKQKGAHPLHLRVSAFALVVGYSFCQKTQDVKMKYPFHAICLNFCTFAQKQAVFSGKKPLASAGISLYNGRSEITFHF
ncbi:hypothetical protein [Gemmiger formicilis]|jgi:hypothetical protein|uniref:hypothetical protein n=1 Tax=Gemmiger formicilis TaxID=745368 RepID=UPI003CCB6427